jgi:hypothetical protein
MKSPTESALVQGCLDLLKLKGILAWRSDNAGVRRSVAGRTFWSFSGLKGVSDILGIVEGGRLLAVECKAPQGKVSPDQQWFIDTVQALGGLAGVVRCISDLEKLLAELD